MGKKKLIDEINGVLCILLKENIFNITSSNCMKIKCIIENKKCTTYVLKNIDDTPIVVIPLSIVKKEKLKRGLKVKLFIFPSKNYEMTLPKDLLEALNRVKLDISKLPEFELKQFVVLLKESETLYIRKKRLENIMKSLQD